MIAIHAPVAVAAEDHAAFCPIFLADWRDALFIHVAVDPAALQPAVPLPLDLYDGQAYLSLVAFTQANLRPAIGGRLAAWLSAPLATHEFLNLRAYVRRGTECGIYFLAEWIPNRLATLIGPRLYGLPYRLGRLHYATHSDGHLSRNVASASGRFHCDATIDTDIPPARSAAGSEAEFLLERYTAFTWRNGILRRFHIRHDPWLHTPAHVTLDRSDLLEAFPSAKLCAAHYSKGIKDVAIGQPERCFSS